MWSAISRSLPQFAPARRPHARRRPMLECLEDRALLSTIPITVSSLADSGGGTLRLAIATADVRSTTNNYVINIKTPGTITLESALPDLRNNITIHGLGAGTLTVQRDTSLSTPFRIFTVDAGETVKISGLTIAGGNAGLLGISHSGGGIDNSGTLTVSDSVFTSNFAGYGYGGGLANEDGGTLTVRGCTFTSNFARFGGGGLFNDSGGTATVSDSTFTGNNERFGGGGLANSGTLTVIGSTFTSNSTSEDDGGGLANSGTLTVTGSIFINNSASYIYGDGGGLANSGTLTVTGSIFTGNSAGYNGGGIDNSPSGTATVKGSSFNSNSAEFGGGIFNNNTIDVTVKDSTFKSNVDSVVGGGAIYGPWIGSGNFFSTTNT